MRFPGKGGRAAIAASLLAAASPAAAQWPISPSTNLPVSTAIGDQAEPASASDGAGGVFVAWADRRGGVTWDVYLQRVTGAGTIAPGWPAGGLAVTTNTGSQANLAIAPDGSGGVVIAWQDRRTGDVDLLAQRIRANATLAPGWPAGGRPLCTTPGVQGPPAIAPDGSGGAYVVWRDDRAGFANADIFAMHVTGSGAPAAGWPANGLAVCSAPGVQEQPVVAASASGAIFAWQDDRTGAVDGWDIHALRLTPAGVRPAGWPANGLAVCTAAGNQLAPSIVSDGGTGCFVAWEDFRAGLTCNLHASRLNGAGSRPGGWPANGRAVCSSPGDQFAVQLLPDGLGGVIAVWEDYRAGLDNADIYALRMTGGGGNGLGWTANGLAVCTSAGMQTAPVPVSDGFFGVIVAWMDERAGPSQTDIYARRVSLFGAFFSPWPANGVPVTTAAGRQQAPTVVSGASNSALVAWRDFRSGTTSDVYAQRVQGDGVLGSAAATNVAVRDVAGDAGRRVRVAWGASPYDVLPAAGDGGPRVARYVVQRLGRDAGEVVAATLAAAAPSGAPDEEPGGGGPAEWLPVASVEATGAASYEVEVATAVDSSEGNPAPYTFRVAAYSTGPDSLVWWSDPATGASVADPGGIGASVTGATTGRACWLAAPAPNPSRGGALLRFGLPASASVRLAVIDVSGREVRALASAWLAAGVHAMRWDGLDASGRPAASGLYFVRLEAAGRALTRRLAVAR
jgi:hypothetical protein